MPFKRKRMGRFMFDSPEFKNILGYRFEEHLPEHSDSPFLINSRLMGCHYCTKDFNVIRNSDYSVFVLHIVFSGCSMLRIAGCDYLLKKGDAFLISEGEEHCYRNAENSELGYLWIELYTNNFKELFQYFKVNNIHTLDAAYTKKVTIQLIDILNYIKNNETKNNYELSAKYYALLLTMIEATTSSPKKAIPKMITESLHFIDKNFTTDLQLADIAEHLHVSRSYLTKQFKSYLGASPFQYIIIKRIEYACCLLRTTRLSCEKIAESVGFYDSSHFTRTFTRIMDTSPSTYRKSVGSPESNA